MLRLLPLLAIAPLCLSVETLPEPSLGSPATPQDPVAEVFAAGGIHLDRDAGLVAFGSQVLVTNELLEYLLVGAAGAAHESLLVTDVTPSLINAAILSLGVEPGQNARYELKDPAPTEAELRAGAGTHDLVLPEGDGLLPYLAWREGAETYLLRAEDALCNLAEGRTMRRHRWVYLGSRFETPRGGGEEIYVADVEQNLMNLAIFSETASLMTGALPECQHQTIWRANAWLLPPSGQPVMLILAKDRLVELPPDLAERLPEPDREREEPRR